MVNEESLISSPIAAEPHPYSNLEWWYCYAFFTGSRGNRYALIASFFCVGETAALKGHYLIYSFIRLDGGIYDSRACLDRMLAYQLAGFYLPMYLFINPADGGTWNQYKNLLQGRLPLRHSLMAHASVQAEPARLQYGSSALVFSNGPSPNFQLKITDRSADIRLNFTPKKPFSTIDESGEINGLRYYSSTRNEVLGELSTGNGTESLSGEGWFDHQWGRNYSLLQGSGWDWFGLQLEDGSELLINSLHKAASPSPPSPMAKIINKEGRVSTTKNVVLKPLKYWKSPYTGIRYPVEWHISLLDLSMELHIIPLLNNQEIPIIGPIQAIWEGACTAAGNMLSPLGHRTPIKGKGFAELVGYAR